MDLAARPHITAGVALASAAVIAAGPMAQHLPNLHVAQQLPQVSVSDINLTGADSVLDLFSGVENELASLANGAAAAAVPANLLTDFQSWLPVQTWVNLFQHAAANGQYLYSAFSQTPFPVLQQVAVNWLYYGDNYVEPWQTAANAAVTYFTSSKAGAFWPTLQLAQNAYLAGNLTTAVHDLELAVLQNPFTNIGEPLENILSIPYWMSHVFSTGLQYTIAPSGAILKNVGLLGVLGLGTAFQNTLGSSLQAISNAWPTDPAGLLANVANLPGNVINGLINGTISGKSIDNGLLSTPAFGNSASNGLFNEIVKTLLPGLAQSMVAPGAPNVTEGGSLATAFQGFINQLTQGWPSLSPFVSNISGSLTALLQNLPSILSNLPSMLSNTATALAGQIGTFITAFLKLL
ncbi:hypothetical protein H7H82_00160 [Mycobacterium heidelbergense]|uniref:hypothetical protein n=1 Tax=Mycobacterium heidelbergense TaxID=53376 RepID=UPI00115397E3|nr:hypothetical protein [Mycobacterium heidelbergense]MCV7049034.1 hypothetical protein [Mycobacterium heidelbergense]BBZ50370.1 hypothetical protein MHEI_20870 [Mycobacterium heidelbergense]